MPEGNQPGSEEMVGTANRKLPKVKSAETKVYIRMHVIIIVLGVCDVNITVDSSSLA